ncbi:P-loop containing nucleoside triphosphate hydrolase protein [Dothidotthia symphoricarpi CBS 119687]|uniref:ATP-dependent RNA helicase ROK1 n=1 Tax=Dothidotthia symphoricarpi CBS 119687 TaxID=1392245 RepID=A0A6A6ABJ7_9PLEO|nr:P-loop containing nucleoside triphosphate hydrolase protein [Dothidotthia symphoricarpi CBS 119687]KAF2128081.1 P-loop containing nucleoside triphosphate hydrolase protein [Dothidotthia symphoricarpi CBS 119687]
MDVFKLLSRSSKTAQTSSALKLPSNGAVANPQLFGHDDHAESAQESNKSRKRKRGQNTESATNTSTPPTATALPAELDFFGGGGGNTGDADGVELKKSRKERKAKKIEESATENGVDDIEETPYDADESKRILRSHKLKITVLEDFAPVPEPSKKEKKKRKKEKVEKEKEKKKDSKKQLYPQPLTSFTQLRPRYAISRRLAENIQEQGYKLPTEVQLGVLPLLLGKKRRAEENESGAEFGGDIDLLTVAPTGSGKTIAFLIPIINAMLAGNKDTDVEEGPRAVVVAPTRELASQIVNEARKLAKGTGIKATLMRKGMEVVARPEDEILDDVPNSPGASDDDDSASGSDVEEKPTKQKKQNRRRAELVKAAIIVATPLALLNALKRRDGSVAALPTIRQLVLDEADVLLDPLFREQTLALWNTCTNPKLRVCLCSATMGSNIESLAISTLNERWSNLSTTTTALPPRPPLIRLVVGLKDTAIPNIAHQLTYAATEQGKLLGIRQLLHPTSVFNNNTPTLRPPFLVFTQTIPRAIALHSELLYDIPPEAGGSSRIAVLHADLSSSARDAIMTRFRRGEIWVLITTDLLARGVDFRGLNGVVNYDVPSSAAAYVHRVGRTGRAGREGGVAVTFYTLEDIPYVKLIANVIRASEQLRGVKEEEGSVKQWLLDALPNPSKRDRKTLKKRGVESRRSGVKGEEAKKGRISTKSGYVRKMENNRRGAVEGSKRREAEAGKGAGGESGGESGAESGFEG